MGKPRNVPRRRAEPVLPLINIVFLMLIFFLVAAQVGQSAGEDIALVRTDEPEFRPPADAIVIHADGRLTWREGEISEAGLAEIVSGAANDALLRLLPDRAAPASAVIGAARVAIGAGAGRVVIVTERALQ